MSHTAKKVAGKIVSLKAKKGRSKGKISVVCTSSLKTVETFWDDSVPVNNYREFLRDTEDDTWWCLVTRKTTFALLRQVMVLEARDRTPKTRAEKRAAKGNVTRM